MKRDWKKRILIRYLVISAFCVVFSKIYHYFSHKITSPWMTFLFVWPLFLGALPAALRVRGCFPGFFYGGENDVQQNVGRDGRTEAENGEKGWFRLELYRFGIAALTVSSLLTGILEIAGTDSDYPGFLRAAGAVMVAAGALLMIVSRHRA